MEQIEKIAIGLVLFVVTSIVAYLFRMRQLYVAVPKLYRHAPISKDGSLCEMIVYNRGNQVEESIQVDLDPELRGELIASSSADITFEGATMKIERLHKGSEASAMILIENGTFDATRIISVSSKATKGSVLKTVRDLPPNFAKAFLVAMLYLGFFPALVYGPKVYDQLHSEYVEYRLQSLYQQGWTNLSTYYGSEMRQSYSDHEFPIRLIDHRVNSEKKPTMTFEVYNKTALPMSVTANKRGSQPGDISNYASADLPPMSKQTLSAPVPERSSGSQNTELEFTLKAGDEFLFGLVYVANP